MSTTARSTATSNACARSSAPSTTSSRRSRRYTGSAIATGTLKRHTARGAGEGAKAAAAKDAARPRRTRRRRLSTLTVRILALNIIPLGIFVAGLLYLGQYRDELQQAALGSLATQAKIFAGALGEGATTGPDGSQSIDHPTARSLLRRLVQPTNARARLFDETGTLIADSRQLPGPGGTVQVEILAPPDQIESAFVWLLDLYQRLADWMVSAPELEPYIEGRTNVAQDYPEAQAALAGEAAAAVRALPSGAELLSVAVPVQRFKQVLGAVMVTTTSREVDAGVREVRLGIIKVFGVALVVTVLLSLYLAGTIARPVRRLAGAANAVRLSLRREQEIPDFTARHDEIGDLSGALREMTDALWLRMDAVESFAADVAHEIKNPLTSLRSAVETAARVTDPEQQRRLLAIVKEDVQRLDRLITDISDASRLDAELSREHMARVDIGALVAGLIEVRRQVGATEMATIVYDGPADGSLGVPGIEDRLAQVFNNLLSNALSFSPPGGEVVVRARREGREVVIAVEDQGPGIPEGSEERIFERFYSERPESEKFGTHSGLGLSISRQIVAAHGGTIRAENRRDAAGAVAGARFVVRLPAQ
jgi:two-component system sensor histidine kinase ChvG